MSIQGGRALGRKSTLWEQIPEQEIAVLHPNALEAKDPERFKCIVQLLKEGCSWKAISRATRASDRTIEKIAQSDPSLQLSTVALASKSAKLAHHAGDALMERLEAAPDAIATKDLSVLYGIAADKVEKLTASQTPQHQTNIQINVGEAKDLNALTSGLDSNGAKVVDAEEVKPKDDAN